MRSLLLWALLASTASAFSPAFLSVPRSPSSLVRRSAGGFEWEDPGSEAFDQGVDNPYKNEALQTEDGLKVDPARLLGPRLNGSNLYLIGMMGSGKSAVGNIVARRKLTIGPGMCNTSMRLTH